MKVWLLTDGEPLFFEQGKSCHRVGSLAQELADQGHQAIWWTSRMDHNSKIYNQEYEDNYKISEFLQVNFLKSAGYKRNMSIGRVIHARSIAKEFLKLSQNEENPDIIVASMPSPELSLAGSLYAKRHKIPFVVDIRDPWPDIFEGYFPSFFKIFLAPLIYYYRSLIRKVTSQAAGIIAVSRSQLDWGISYSGREFDINRDKLLYIGYESNSESGELKKTFTFSPENPMICMYITSWGSSYDAHTLVETAKILQEEVGQQVKIIATGDGESRKISMSEAGGLKNINFTGFISSEDMDNYLSKSHIGLILMKGGITKYWIGNKIGEYIASSFGIVNNVETEVADLIEKNCIGLNVPHEDPRAAADAIIEYLHSPLTLQNHMNNSKELYNKSFNRRKNSKDYIVYLEDVSENFKTKDKSNPFF